MIDELLGLVYIITVFCENVSFSDKDCFGYLVETTHIEMILLVLHHPK
jgi:hypothetical protein